MILLFFSDFYKFREITILLFFVKEAKAEVIKDFSVSFTFISLSDEKIFNKEGSNKNVTSNEIINPKVIIQPKSIIGFIPLNTKDKKAQIVVKTV